MIKPVRTMRDLNGEQQCKQLLKSFSIRCAYYLLCTPGILQECLLCRTVSFRERNCKGNILPLPKAQRAVDRSAATGRTSGSSSGRLVSTPGSLQASPRDELILRPLASGRQGLLKACKRPFKKSFLKGLLKVF